MCTKLFVGWGFAQDLIGKLTALPKLLVVFKGLLVKGGDRISSSFALG